MAELTKEAYFDWLGGRVNTDYEEEFEPETEREIYTQRKQTPKKLRSNGAAEIKNVNLKQPKQEKLITLRGKNEAQKRNFEPDKGVALREAHGTNELRSNAYGETNERNETETNELQSNAYGETKERKIANFFPTNVPQFF